MNVLTVAGLAIGMAMTCTSAAAQEFTLDQTMATTMAAITYQVPEAGAVLELDFVQARGTAGTPVRLSLTTFLSAGGDTLTPRLLKDPKDGAAGREVVFKEVGEIVRVYLVVPSLPGAGPYAGSVLIRSGTNQPARQPVNLVAGTPARPAVLQVSQDTIVRATTKRPFAARVAEPPETLDRTLGPVFDIRVSDQAERWPVVGLRTGPPQVTKVPPGINLSEHLAFYDVRNKLIREFPATTPKHGIALKLQLINPVAGEYTATIPFYAANAALEPRNFSLNVTVKHPWPWPVLCLAIALLLSFAASKLVSIRNERLRLVQRIQDVRPGWLESEPETVAVVWILSIANQATKLSRKWLLPSLDTINARLDRAQALLVRVDRLRRIRSEIVASRLPRLAHARALKIASSMANRLDPDMNEEELTIFTNDLGELRGWTREGESVARYSSDLAQAIGMLLASIDLRSVPELYRPDVEALMNALRMPSPTTIADLEERERTYATLKILWERRASAEFEGLITAHRKKGSLEQLFKLADETAWVRVEQSSARRLVCEAGQQVEAWDPLTFAFTTGSDELDATFLVQQGLHFDWKFVLQNSKGVLELKPSGRPPRVPQFAPFAGVLTPSVRISFPGKQPLDVVGDPLTVTRSVRFAAFNGFSFGELVQLFLAFVVAVITGLQTFYDKAAGFGLFSDYLSLFAWGATVDQLKNFLQRLPAAVGTGTQSVTSATVPGITVTTGASGGRGGVASVAATPAVVTPAPPTVPALAGAAQSAVQAAPAVGAGVGAGVPVPDIPNPPRPGSLNLGGN